MSCSKSTRIKGQRAFGFYLIALILLLSVTSPSLFADKRFKEKTEPSWSAMITATGEVAGSATNVSNVIIGANDMGPATIPAPPTPPQYTVNLQLWPLNFIGGGPFFQDIRARNVSGSMWVLEVDPHGNVPPPTPRMATVSWNAADLGSGNYELREGFDGMGSIHISDMKTVTSFVVTGTSSQFYTIVFNPVMDPTNNAPELDPLSDHFTMNEGELLDIPVTAMDVDGDNLTFTTTGLPSFGTLIDHMDGTATLRFNPAAGEAGVYPDIEVIVTDDGMPNLSDADTLTLTVNAQVPLSCSVEINAPVDGFITCEDSVEVCFTSQVSGGSGTITKACTINGAPVSGFCSEVPLIPGNNQIIVKCTFIDSLGNSVMCSDTVNVSSNHLACQLEFTSPDDSSFVCDSLMTLTGHASVTGGVTPVSANCTVDGMAVSLSAGDFAATLSLSPGLNSFEAVCTFTDSAGCSATCRDTLVAFSDTTPPECTFNFDNLPVITGEALDPESGIAKVEVVSINNRTLDVDPFTPGDPVVGFSSDIIDITQSGGFMLRVTNRAGCEILCDPIYLRLDPANTPCNFTFSLPSTDRFLFIHNQGLEQILMTINEKELRLVATKDGTGRNGDTYFIPVEGKRTIDLIAYLKAGENDFELHCTGPDGASADILISDIKVDDGTTTAVTAPSAGSGNLPDAFALHQNYPNPFNPETTIEFEIPAAWSSHVTLGIYNLQGQLLLTLVDNQFSPGRHRVVWDGKDHAGRKLASGVYFYKVVSGNHSLIRRMLLAK